MTAPDPATATAWGLAIACFCMAIFERFKNSKKEKKTGEEEELLSDAKMFSERADAMAKLASDNLNLYKQEHQEHISTREFWHVKSSEFQSTLSKCQEKLAEFQSRPDFTDIMQFIKQNSQTSVEILAGIRQILETIHSQTKNK